MLFIEFVVKQKFGNLNSLFQYGGKDLFLIDMIKSQRWKVTRHHLAQPSHFEDVKGT